MFNIRQIEHICSTLNGILESILIGTSMLQGGVVSLVAGTRGART